jgi:hypothetical protein
MASKSCLCFNIPRIEINTEKEVATTACYFTTSIAPAHRIPTGKISLSDINNHNLPELDHWLKHKQRLQKLWQETWDPTCKTAVNWVEKTIRKMNSRKALDRLEINIGNCGVIPQAYCLL